MINELRSGNWIFAFGKGNVQVTSINADYVNGGLQENILKGIELTEDTLQRCGFIKEYNCFYFHGVPEPLSLFYNKYGDVCIEEYGEGEVPLEHIKYLHQLQNLYVFLSGKELKVKL